MKEQARFNGLSSRARLFVGKSAWNIKIFKLLQQFLQIIIVKKQFIIVAFAIVTFSSFPLIVRAQTYNNSISGDVIGLLLGHLDVTYERRLSAENSYTIFGNYYFGYPPLTGLAAGASYRWYFDTGEGQKALEGLSAGPLADIAFWSGGGFNSVSLQIGGTLQYKWIINDAIVIEPVVGFVFNVNSVSGLNGFFPIILGVRAGYAWN